MKELNLSNSFNKVYDFSKIELESTHLAMFSFNVLGMDMRN